MYGLTNRRWFFPFLVNFLHFGRFWIYLQEHTVALQRSAVQAALWRLMDSVSVSNPYWEKYKIKKAKSSQSYFTGFYSWSALSHISFSHLNLLLYVSWDSVLPYLEWVYTKKRILSLCAGTHTTITQQQYWVFCCFFELFLRSKQETRYDMQQRSQVGVKPETMQLFGMRWNNSATWTLILLFK